MKKLRVLVLQGGTSAEHEVSLASGKMVAEGLDRETYDVTSVTITKQGTWIIPDKHFNTIKYESVGTVVYEAGAAMDEIRARGYDVVFIALHGTFGEDGIVQGLLELVGIPYTGSGVFASALAMDKVKSAEVLQFHGLAVPRMVTFSHEEWIAQPEVISSQIAATFGFPLMIKPRDSGSSVGISLVASLEELAPAIERALLERPRAIAQEFIKGTEVTCSVLDDGRGTAVALMPTEIIANAGEFYDYESKYASGGSTHVLPPKLPDEIIAAIQKIACRAHTALGCSGMSRTDMMVRDGEIFVLEVNTIPGLTPTSLFPEAAAAVGITFGNLLDRVITAALSRSYLGKKMNYEIASPSLRSGSPWS